MDIAHEMLIVGWPASRESGGVPTRGGERAAPPGPKAEEWARLGRGESGLLDRAELAEADAWLEGPDAVIWGSTRT